MSSIGRGKSGELSETQAITEAIRISQSPHVMNRDQEKLLTFFQQKISEYCILNPLKQLTK